MSITGIPPRTIGLLWGKAGGRCQYSGCNEALYADNLTKQEFAYETIVPDYALQKDFSKIYRKIKEHREHLANTDFENKLFGPLSQKAFNGDL